MNLSDIQASVYRRTITNIVSFPLTDQTIEFNRAYEKFNAKIRQFLDNYYPTLWSSSDITTGTAVPVGDSLFHDLIPLYVSFDRAVERSLPSAPGFLNRITDLEKDLEQWYGVKNFVVCGISIASPGVINKKNHGLIQNDMVQFVTSGALPTGLTAGVFYYVLQIIDPDNFTVAATQGGTVIATSGTQSGQQYFSSDRDKAMRSAYHDNR